MGRSPVIDRERHESLVGNADLAARNGDYAAAERLLEQLASSSTEPMIWQRLAATRRARSNFSGALEAIDRALTLRPRDAMALLAKGAFLEKLGRDAEEPYAAALAFVGNVDFLPPAVRARFAEARRYCENAKRLRTETIERRLKDALAGLQTTPSDRVRAERFAEAIADNRAVLPFLSGPPFYDPDSFENVHALAQRHASFTAEYFRLMADETNASPYVVQPPGVPLDQWAELNESTRWNAAHLIQGGIVREPNGSACPETMAGYGLVPAPVVPGRSPNLMFSILAPHTHIPPHTGVSNARLVLHIPLVIPENCSLTVGGETRQWFTGTPMVFDDTIEHEAMNASSATRVVLIGDIWHPDLSGIDRTVLSSLMAIP